MDDTMAAELNALVRNVAFASRRAAGEWVQGSGLTRQQAFALGYLHRHQGREVIARELAEVTRTTPSSVTSLLQGLEERGFIERVPAPNDSRRKIIRITQAGSQVAAGFDDAMGASQTELFSVLTADQQRQLAGLLGAVLDSYAERHPEIRFRNREAGMRTTQTSNSAVRMN